MNRAEGIMPVKNAEEGKGHVSIFICQGEAYHSYPGLQWSYTACGNGEKNQKWHIRENVPDVPGGEYNKGQPVFFSFWESIPGKMCENGKFK